MNEKKLIQALKLHFDPQGRLERMDCSNQRAATSRISSPSLRACSQLHQLHRQLSRELFNAAFVAGLTWEVNPKRKFCVLWRLRFARTRFRRRSFRPYSNLQSSWNTTISLFLSTRTRWHHLRSNIMHMPKLCTTRNRSFRNSCVNPLRMG